MRSKYLQSALNLGLYVLLFILCTFGLIRTDSLNKVSMITLCILFIISFIIFTKLYLSRKEILYNINSFIVFLLNIILLYGIINMSLNYNFLSPSYKIESYNIYVLNNTTYKDKKELSGKTIGILNMNEKNTRDSLNRYIKTSYKTYNDIDELTESLTNGTIQGVLLSEDKYQELKKENNLVLNNRLKAIDKVKVKEKIK